MKRAMTWVLALVLIMMTAGCKARFTKSYTFRVETGDNIKVKLDATDDYDITSDVPFVITCDGEELSQGIFVTEEQYEQYVEAAETDEKAEILETGEKDGNEYVFWCYDDSEWNYAIFVDDSDTGVVLANPNSEEEAKECFDRLTITVDE